MVNSCFLTYAEESPAKAFLFNFCSKTKWKTETNMQGCLYIDVYIYTHTHLFVCLFAVAETNKIKKKKKEGGEKPVLDYTIQLRQRMLEVVAARMT